ncbi:hypothetical protein NKR19_g8008 [Coniochaeta hoffmannii]|uniref:Uncharacterized protein n=1 Tax=Coniochaeta hoffmannii TaxID=91930 RepID=A0AA38VKM6_9PEZI|nr:hypothetical protein NKR19_g8008 [Coniochaeta hoffmannii]
MGSLSVAETCAGPPPLPHNVGIALARFRENIDIWEPYAPVVQIYDKGDISPENDTIDRTKFLSYEKRPNKGREGESWLYHIVTHYDNLPEYNIFSQASPWDILGAAFNNPEPMLEVCLDLKPGGFTPFNEDLYHVVADWDKINWTDPKEALWMTPSQLRSLDFADMTPGEYWMQVLGIQHPPSITASHGGTFCASRESILQWPKDVYERALEAFREANSTNPEEGFFQERMWAPMFDFRNWLAENPQFCRHIIDPK